MRPTSGSPDPAQDYVNRDGSCNRIAISRAMKLDGRAGESRLSRLHAMIAEIGEDGACELEALKMLQDAIETMQPGQFPLIGTSFPDPDMAERCERYLDGAIRQYLAKLDRGLRGQVIFHVQSFSMHEPPPGWKWTLVILQLKPGKEYQWPRTTSTD